VSDEQPDFASGSSGLVLGIRATSRAVVLDAAYDLVSLALLERVRLQRAAAKWPRRRVLALGIERSDEPNVLAEAFAELRRSRHDVTVAQIDVGGRGKWENLNALLEHHPPAGHDWLLIVDDDVVLPPGFLDTFVFLAERFGLSLAQPAHRHRSHAAWQVTRRRPGSLVRETRYVEIGPVCALNASTFDTLLPFPPLRIGWGLDAHWSAIAKERGWKLGVVDATPVRHGIRRIAASYGHEAAFQEMRQFLADRPYTRTEEAQRTIATHRSLR
jgi:Glycosyltransferase like family 2